MISNSNSDNSLWFGVALVIFGVVLAILQSLGLFDSVLASTIQVRASLTASLAKVTTPINELSNTITQIQSISSQNSILKQRNSELLDHISQLENLQEENDFLRSQLNLGVRVPKSSVLSRVLRYEYSPQPGVIYVELESELSISPGDWITSDGFIVGKVTEKYGNIAKSILISSPNFSEPVVIGPEQEIGLLESGSGEYLAISGVDITKQIDQGDEVRLLQSNSLHLKDYRVGYVTEVLSEDQSPNLQITVSTPVDLSNMDYVLVIGGSNVN